jgi:hypothetical protein
MRSLLVVSVLFLSGCLSMEASVPAVAPVKTGSGYTLEIRRANGTATVQGRNFMINRDNVSLELQDGKLTVNGKDMGAIAEGSTIAINEEGVVLVNGEEREPSPN